MTEPTISSGGHIGDSKTKQDEEGNHNSEISILNEENYSDGKYVKATRKTINTGKKKKIKPKMTVHRKGHVKESDEQQEKVPKSVKNLRHEIFRGIYSK
ncbi:hypothetical protein JTB14_031272 [Gonioctena quinquepunctata]|nr:hypothetical protein JTB14_031272 [Gonioctena quinquepunctata]